MITDTDDRLAKLTATIEAGSPADLVAPRMNQLRTDKLRAEAELRAAQPPTTCSPHEIRQLVDALGDITTVLADADKKQKAQLYEELGLELVFDPERNRVSVGVSIPCTRSVSEGRLVQPPHHPRWSFDIDS